MRASYLTAIAVSLLVGCGGAAKSAPQAPAPAPAPPAAQPAPDAVQHEDPPAADQPHKRTTLGSTIPPGWVRVPGKPFLLNPPAQAGILFQIYETRDKDAKAELEETLTKINGVKAGKVQTSPDGNRAWATLTGTDPKKPARGKLVVRHLPKEADTPADLMIECWGMWPATAPNDDLAKDLDAYIDGFKFE